MKYLIPCRMLLGGNCGIHLLCGNYQSYQNSRFQGLQITLQKVRKSVAKMRNLSPNGPPQNTAMAKPHKAHLNGSIKQTEAGTNREGSAAERW